MTSREKIMREALEQIVRETSEHPMFMGADATYEEIDAEGGDAATITHWHKVAAEALK